MYLLWSGTPEGIWALQAPGNARNTICRLSMVDPQGKGMQWKRRRSWRSRNRVLLSPLAKEEERKVAQMLHPSIPSRFLGLLRAQLRTSILRFSLACQLPWKVDRRLASSECLC